MVRVKGVFGVQGWWGQEGGGDLGVVGIQGWSGSRGGGGLVWWVPGVVGV